MKKAYLITYNLNYYDNYEALEIELKSSKKWWHFLDRTWIIISEETPKEIWDRIKNKINQDNNLLIIEVKNNSEGWLSAEAWSWIKENIKGD